MNEPGDRVLRGIVSGAIAFVVLTVPAVTLHPGNPVGIALTVLAFSPVAFLVAGAVASRQRTSEEMAGVRRGTRRGLVAGTVLGIAPAVAIGYLLWGTASVGGGFSAFGLALSVGIVLLVPVVSGAFGGAGGALASFAGRRVRVT